MIFGRHREAILANWTPDEHLTFDIAFALNPSLFVRTRA